MVENPSWKNILESDIDQLVHYCETFDLPGRGDEDSLKERLLRHVFSISLPAGEMFLQGKININRASAEEMRLWPFMGETLINNIIEYREKYGRFYKVEDLLNVKGVGPNLFKKLVQFVDVSGRTQIKIMKELSTDVDIELIKLEDEIRQKAWELQDLQDHLNLNMESIGDTRVTMEGEENQLSQHIREVEELRSGLARNEERMEKLRGRLEKEYKRLRELSKRKREEIQEVRKQMVVLEQVLPWNFVLKADLEELRQYCKDYDLSPRGDAASLRDRLMRHILKINLPTGEQFLEGKLNINTASPEEMILWPNMGNTLVRNIMDYRRKYGKFNKVDDLLNVNGVGENLFKKLVQFVDVTGKTHIKVKRSSRADADMELIQLEDDIRNKAWELQDLKEHLDLDIESFGGIMDTVEEKEIKLTQNLNEFEQFRGSLAKSEAQLATLRDRLNKEYKRLRELVKRKREEIRELHRQQIVLEQVLPWGFILQGDLEELQQYCKQYDLSPRGDEASLRDRLIRHVLKINLPTGELFLKGKLNVNTASPEEMGMWPFMGNTLVRNIMDYREKYGKFNKVEDLLNVKGVGNNLFKKLIHFVDVSGKTHIKVKKEYKADADLELIRLEDDIRNKAWEMQDLKEHLDLDLDHLIELMSNLEYERESLTDNLGDMDEFQARLIVKEKELEGLKATMEMEFETINKLVEEKENAHQKMLDLQEEAESNRRLTEERLGEIEEEKDRLIEEREQLARERADLQMERPPTEMESEVVSRIDVESGHEILDKDKDMFRFGQDDIEKRFDELAAREKKLDKRKDEIDTRAQALKDREENLGEIAHGLGTDLKDLEIKTIDIPVIVQRDPDDNNPEDERVILDSTDGYIRRVMNVYYEGQKLDENYSRVIFKNMPLKKIYNILIDTGERRYFLMKNFNPGGAS